MGSEATTRAILAQAHTSLDGMSDMRTGEKTALGAWPIMARI